MGGFQEELRKTPKKDHEYSLYTNKIEENSSPYLYNSAYDLPLLTVSHFNIIAHRPPIITLAPPITLY